jgi:hypothetical protein
MAATHPQAEQVKSHPSLEHIETNEDNASTHHEKIELEHQYTLGEIDLENKAAHKGDDSDGHVDWTFKTIMASIFLAQLYTGMPPSLPRGFTADSRPARLPDHPLFRRRLSTIYCAGHSRRSRLCVTAGL